MSDKKKVSWQAVSAVLKRAGFSRADRKVDYFNRSAGFYVWDNSECVRVGWHSRPPWRDDSMSKLEDMAKALFAAGFPAVVTDKSPIMVRIDKS